MTFNINYKKSLKYDINKSYTASPPKKPWIEKETNIWKEYKINLKNLIKESHSEEDIYNIQIKITNMVERIMKGKDWELAKVCVITRKDEKEGYFGYFTTQNIGKKLHRNVNYGF
jgi:hypothetical protein